MCPVATLQRYLNIAEINENSEEFIFRSVTTHKNNEHRTLKKENLPLSYARARELFLTVVTPVGIETERFLLHSLRSGGTSAAANVEVNNRLFKRHGCWVISIMLGL